MASKNVLIKKLGEDIWGYCSLKDKINKFHDNYLELYWENKEGGREGLFRIDVNKPLKRSKRKTLYGNLMLLKYKLDLFYGGFNLKEFKFYCKVGQRGDFVNVIEKRLDVFLYRSFLTFSIEESKHEIKRGYFMVNKEIIIKPGHILKVGDVVEVVDVYKEQIFNKIERFFYNVGGVCHHIEVNITNLSAILIDEPKVSLVSYPFKVEERWFWLLSKLYSK